MKKIALISDTHGYLDPRVIPHLEASDEIWHAGDVGKEEVLFHLEKMKPFRGVYGNIDGGKVRASLKEWIHFKCEDVNVLITHIGGYPGKYRPNVPEKIVEHKPNLFICGHSHILKVMWDKKYNLLHMNPGACGIQGMHKVQTILLFEINGEKIENLRIVEMERKKTTG